MNNTQMKNILENVVTMLKDLIENLNVESELVPKQEKSLIKIKLKYNAKCNKCNTFLKAGYSAYYDKANKKLYCGKCK